MLFSSALNFLQMRSSRYKQTAADSSTIQIHQGRDGRGRATPFIYLNCYMKSGSRKTPPSKSPSCPPLQNCRRLGHDGIRTQFLSLRHGFMKTQQFPVFLPAKLGFFFWQYMNLLALPSRFWNAKTVGKMVQWHMLLFNVLKCWNCGIHFFLDEAPGMVLAVSWALEFCHSAYSFSPSEENECCVLTE